MKALLLEIARWAVALAAVISLVLMFRADPISDADPVAVRAAATEQMDHYRYTSPYIKLNINIKCG